MIQNIEMETFRNWGREREEEGEGVGGKEGKVGSKGGRGKERF